MLRSAPAEFRHELMDKLYSAEPMKLDDPDPTVPTNDKFGPVQRSQVEEARAAFEAMKAARQQALEAAAKAASESDVPSSE